MKIWIDDVRPIPEGYSVWCQSVNAAIKAIQVVEQTGRKIEVIDLDHDAGDFVSDGGDFIRVLDWLEATGRSYPIRIHTMNPVGRENMQRIIRKNGWKEKL